MSLHYINTDRLYNMCQRINGKFYALHPGYKAVHEFSPPPPLHLNSVPPPLRALRYMKINFYLLSIGNKHL